MKTELSRRTLLQIPLLAAVSAVPSLDVEPEYDLQPFIDYMQALTAEARRLAGIPIPPIHALTTNPRKQ